MSRADPAPCPRCDGEGITRSGIDEAPRTICPACNGVGDAQEAVKTSRADLDEQRALFNKTFLSLHSFHTKAELDKEWFKTGAMFQAALALGKNAQAPVPGKPVELTDDQLYKVWHDTYRNAHTFKSTLIAYARAAIDAARKADK